MSILIDIVLFTIALILGSLLFTVTALPIFYGMSRSIAWTVKGKVRASACLFYLRGFGVRVLVFGQAVSILWLFFPHIVTYLYDSDAFFFGQWFGVIYPLFYALSKSGRQSLNKDFLAAMEGFRKCESLSDLVDMMRANAVETRAMSREEAERLITPAIIQDIFSLSRKEVDIVGAFGGVVASLPGPLRPLSKLPYPKETIRKAFEKLLAQTKSPYYKSMFQTGLFALDDFIPDEEIPLNEEENIRKWMMLRFLMMDIKHLRNRTAKLGEDELLNIAITNSHKFHPSATRIAREELRGRGYTIDEQEDEAVVTSPARHVSLLPPLPKPPPIIQETEVKSEAPLGNWTKKIVKVVTEDSSPGLAAAGLLLLSRAIIGVLLQVAAFTITYSPTIISLIIWSLVLLDAWMAIGLLRKDGFIISREGMRKFAKFRMIAVIIVIPAGAARMMSELPSPTTTMLAIGACQVSAALGLLLLLFNPAPSTTRFRIGIGVCLLGILGQNFLGMIWPR